jgi:hypothetical protein
MKFTDTTYSAATTSAAGLMSADDKTKLNGIASGAQVNSITGVKGDSESSYRTGNVNLTAANIGAAAASDVSVSANIPMSTFATGNGVVNIVTCLSCINKHGRHVTGFIMCRTYNTAPSATGNTRDNLFTIKSGYIPSSKVSAVTLRTLQPTTSDGWTTSYSVINTSGVVQGPLYLGSFTIIILLDYFTA